MKPGKKLFNELLTRASQPVPKAQDKGRHPKKKVKNENMQKVSKRKASK